MSPGRHGDHAQRPHRAACSSTQELRAWRGLLRTHATLVKALDAELEAAHGLPLTSYEVLMYLADAEDERMRMCDLADRRSCSAAAA